MRVKAWIGVAALALLTTACAGGHSGRPEPGFGEEEGDGIERPRIQLFISPAGQPFRAPPGGPYPSAAWFASADSDHDGRLTREEFRADAQAWFKALDANGDGQVGMIEVSRWEEDMVPEITRVGPGGFAGGGPRGRNALDTRRQGAAAYSLINEPHPIRGADSDFSMGVSVAEWRTAADRRFALLDPDGDGAVLLTDLRRTPAQAGTKARKSDARPPIGAQRRRR